MGSTSKGRYPSNSRDQGKLSCSLAQAHRQSRRSRPWPYSAFAGICLCLSSSRQGRCVSRSAGIVPGLRNSGFMGVRTFQGIDYPVTKFEFLGFEFRLRSAKTREGRMFTGFLPAISPAAAKAIQREVGSWNIPNKTDKSIEDLSRMFSPTLMGWINYYQHIHKSAMYPTMYNFNRHLVKWVTRKYKRFRQRPRRAHYWLGRISHKEPNLFPHWKIFGLKPSAG